MEAASLKSKKQAISKGKIKKTLKNIICRPDQVEWPTLPENHQDSVKKVLKQYKVQLPEFEKVHWKQLKNIPKEQRPKPPKLERVEGLIFGISECNTALEKQECSAIMIESSVNPRSIMQSVLDTCISQGVPVVCIDGLKTLSLSCFGIPTSCSGVKRGFLPTISRTVLEASHYTKKSLVPKTNNMLVESKEIKTILQEDIELTEKPSKNVKENTVSLPSKHVIENIVSSSSKDVKENTVPSPYLYRKNKKERVFVPPDSCRTLLESKEFSGQSFIKLPDPIIFKKVDKNSYMNMIVKKVSNNPNRKKGNQNKRK